MQFSPKSQEELEKENAYLQPGNATFKVINAIDGISSKGDPMITLELHLWDEKGKEGVLKDWLPSTFQYKIFKFCNSINRIALYQSGDLNPFALINATGKCTLKLKKGDDGESYIRVHSYLSSSEKDESNSPIPQDNTPSSSMEIDDVPF